jgi:DNA (cytosine-5)-methyltransferase 1
MADLVLSLFPGIGLLDRAFEEEGFCVVRGPDLLWGGDVKRFHPPAGRFDGVIGGPPCQAHSSLRHLVEAAGRRVAEDLIPEYARCVAEASPRWFLMENVPGAPEPLVEGYAVRSVLVCNRWFGAVQQRRRRFVFGVRGRLPLDLGRWLECEALHAVEWEPAVLASEGRSGRPASFRADVRQDGLNSRPRRVFERCCELQGLPVDFDLPGFTVDGAYRAVNNGVPLPMGRAIAAAVRRALESEAS